MAGEQGSGAQGADGADPGGGIPGAKGNEGDKAGDKGKVFTQDEVDRMIAQSEAGLKANRDEALREAKALRESLKAFDGIDASEARGLMKAAEEADRRKAEAEGDFKKLEKQLVERHQKELADKDGRIDKIMGALEKRLIEARLTQAIVAAKGDAELLLPHAAKFVRMRETDDDFEAYVVDEFGTAVVSDGKGTPASFDDLVRERLMPKYPRAFEGVGSSGGGASKSTVGDRGPVGAVTAEDEAAFLANLEAIAAGSVTVRE